MQSAYLKATPYYIANVKKHTYASPGLHEESYEMLKLRQ